MSTNIFTKTPLAISVACVLGVTANQVVNAQQLDEQSDSTEVILVKGIRGSLLRSADIKRGSSGVVDAISAEEMGKFPDTNLAESLQRITGVTISRSNGEGSEITVRGFGPEFNMVTLNGRQMPSTGFKRSFEFENLSSEGVSALEIVKTARADVPSGGVGATVNIVTTKPLQSPGQQLSLQLKGIHDTSVQVGDDITPEIAAVYSHTFNDDTVGLAFSFSHQQRDFQRQQANIQGWHANVDLPDLDAASIVDGRAMDANGEPITSFIDSEGNAIAAHFFPKDMNYGFQNIERERTNAQVTLQWAATDDLTLSLDYTATNAVTGTNTFGWGIWNNFAGNINAYQLDANGTAVYANISGDDGSFTASRDTTEVDSQSIGFNLEWHVNDSLSLELDYHDSSSETDNGADQGLGNSAQVILGSSDLEYKIYDFTEGDIPKYSVLWNNGTNLLGAGEIDSNFSQFLQNKGKTDIQQLRVDGQWLPDFDLALSTVSFGLTLTEQSMTATDAWSGLVGGPGFSPSYVTTFPDSMFTLNQTSSFLDEFSGGGSALSPNYYYTFDIAEAIARQMAIIPDFVPDAYLQTPTTSAVEEDTISLFVSTEWDFEVADFAVTLNAGVRYEQTTAKSPSQSRIAEQVNWVAPSEWITVFASGGDLLEVTNEGEYDLLLPSLDIKVDVTDDVVARFSYGKSIARAGLGFLLGGLDLTGSPKIGARSGSRGNTALKPYQATNLDLSLEYYYDDASYMSLGLFKKDVADWIEGSVVDLTFDGLHDIYLGPRYNAAVAEIEARGEQATDNAIYAQMLANGHGDADGVIEADPNSDPLITWSISSPENVDERSVNGLEFAIQHLFGDSGFGASFNATLVDGDVEYNPYMLAAQQALPGISDSANLQGFYEKDGLSIRITYAWRDDYLIGQGQDQGTTFDSPPQFAETYGQWDFSVNYDIDEHFTVFFEGININNETERGYGRFEEQFLFARQYGPRYIAGARYAF